MTMTRQEIIATTIAALLALVISCAVAITSSAAEHVVLHCFVERANLIQRDCTPEWPAPEGRDWQGGCDQSLAAVSPIFYSRDFPNSGPPYQNPGLCNVFSHAYVRGLTRVRFAPDSGGPEGETWTAIKGIIAPFEDLALIDPGDPLAVPPNQQASGWWFSSWTCDQIVDEVRFPINGPYVYFVSSNVEPSKVSKRSDFELDAFAGWDFPSDPRYRDAYDREKEAFEILRGYIGNPHTPGTPASTIEKFQKLVSIFDDMNLESGGGDSDPLALTGLAVSEYYLVRYGYFDEQRLQVEELWTELPEREELDAAILHLFAMTADAHGDPDAMLEGIDVTVEQSTWGGIKDLYR